MLRSPLVGPGDKIGFTICKYSYIAISQCQYTPISESSNSLRGKELLIPSFWRKTAKSSNSLHSKELLICHGFNVTTSPTLKGINIFSYSYLYILIYLCVPAFPSYSLYVFIYISYIYIYI